MIPISDKVREYIEAEFPPEDVSFVEIELAEAVLPLLDGPSNDRDRVHAAIIHLSKGDRDEFERHLAIARNDWRDTLVAAGF